MDAKTILLVEDNEDDEELAMLAFCKSNIANQVIVARDGLEALDLLFGVEPRHTHALPVLPQVMFLDIKLPKIDGLEVLKQVRANPRTRRLPVVILTSSREEQDLLESYNLGANSYVRKPVDFNQFTAAIQHLHLYWLVLNEVPTIHL